MNNHHNNNNFSFTTRKKTRGSHENEKQNAKNAHYEIRAYQYCIAVLNSKYKYKKLL